MPSISEFYGLSVYMYNNGREHNPRPRKCLNYISAQDSWNLELQRFR